MFEEIDITMDKHGMLVQLNNDPSNPHDGGDTAHRTGHYFFLIQLQEKVFNQKWKKMLPFASDEYYKSHMDDLEPIKGCYVRYPKRADKLEPNHYYCEGTYEGVMSRDQMTPLLISAGYRKDYKRIAWAFLRHMMRGFIFMSNTRRFEMVNGEHVMYRRMPGFAFFEYFNLFLRGLPALGYILYPLVMLFDLETLLSSIFHRMGWSNGDDVANHCAICIYGMQRVPTPVMHLANKINSYKDMKAKQESYWGGWRQMGFFSSMFDRPMRKYFGK